MVFSYVNSMENVWNFHDLISVHWPWKTHGIITDHGFPMAFLLCQNAMEISWIITMGNFYKGAKVRLAPRRTGPVDGILSHQHFSQKLPNQMIRVVCVLHQCHYRATAMLSAVYAVVVCLCVCVRACVCVCVCHTPVLYQNG